MHNEVLFEEVRFVGVVDVHALRRALTMSRNIATGKILTSLPLDLLPRPAGRLLRARLKLLVGARLAAHRRQPVGTEVVAEFASGVGFGDVTVARRNGHISGTFVQSSAKLVRGTYPTTPIEDLSRASVRFGSLYTVWSSWNIDSTYG